MGIFDFLNRGEDTAVADPLGALQQELIELVGPEVGLLTASSVDDEGLDKLSILNDRLGLLTQLFAETATADVAPELQAIANADTDEKVRLIRGIRDRDESEVATLLSHVAQHDNEAAVRKAACSALLYKGEQAGREVVVGVFLSDSDESVKASAVFALDPEHNQYHRGWLLNGFANYKDETLRRAVIGVLNQVIDKDEVTDFFAVDSNFSDAERAYIGSL